MNTTVDIAFNSHFGSEGTGNGQFTYPSGVCIFNNRVYVVDKQNHRIQIFDLAGVYQRQFGSVGSSDPGNYEFFFPEDITTDGTYIYIADSANNRIKVFDSSDVFVFQFGTFGTGNDNFAYPCGIDYYDHNLYIADKQNGRIKVHRANDGIYITEFGNPSGESPWGALLFPEGVAQFEGNIFVADSGNHDVKIFSISGSYISTLSTVFEYPTSVDATNGVLTVVDRQANVVYFFDENGIEITSFGSYGTDDNEFFFPYSAYYFSDKLYIVDSANHRVKICSFTIEAEELLYFDKIIKLTKQLYPTGRAWWMRTTGYFHKLHEGLACSESRAYEDALGLLNSILPDNDLFDEEDATNWENALGLLNQTYLTLDERKAIILRKMLFPGSILARQNHLYLQQQLRAVGFDVYVHPNRFDDGMGGYEPYVPYSAKYGQFEYGAKKYGQSGLAFYIIANYLNESEDAGFGTINEQGLKATFFIGGATFPTFANVPLNRKTEFREMILKMKPAQTVGFLLINYV